MLYPQRAWRQEFPCQIKLKLKSWSWHHFYCGPAHNYFPGLNNFDLGMHFMKEGVYRPFLLYADLSVL